MTAPTTTRTDLRQVVLDFFPADRRVAVDVRQLARRVSSFIVAADEGDRHDAWRDLIAWTRGNNRDGERLRMLVALLDGSEPIRTGVLASLTQLLSETDATGLFSDAGIPTERGFVAELSERVMNHVLPAPRNDEDLAQLLSRLFPGEKEVTALRETPAELFHRIVVVLTPTQQSAMWAPIEAAFHDGFRLLAVRVAAQGLERAIRLRSTPGVVTDSPFHRQLQSASALLEAVTAGNPTEAATKAWRADMVACREELNEVHRRLDNEGVSVDIVYSLEILERALTRMALMVEILNEPAGFRRSATIHRLLTRLADFAYQDRSIRHLFRWNLRLLHRKIVERSGATGEHYIAYSRKEYRHIWLAAAGGGVLTAGTAAIKVAVHHFGLPPFPESFLYGLNYAVSFLLLGAWGLMLATKQPAMTAATLAQLLRDKKGDRVDELVNFTSRIFHSQLAAATSNVIVVSATAWVFNLLWELVAGHPFVNPEDAARLITTLSPLNSGTIFFAALTGVILWLSSVVGGWFDNWSVYHRLPQAIAEHPLGKRLGFDRLKHWAAKLRHNAGNWATSIALGFMLGMTPALGTFFGLPLDVRHVTLSTGTLALASASLGQRMFENGFFRGLAGVATMFVLNLGVSFSLSLYTATRAYQLDPGELKEFVTRLLRRMNQHPRDFILAPKDDLIIPGGSETVLDVAEALEAEDKQH